jgi:hypothetical protein
LLLRNFFIHFQSACDTVERELAGHTIPLPVNARTNDALLPLLPI